MSGIQLDQNVRHSIRSKWPCIESNKNRHALDYQWPCTKWENKGHAFKIQF